MTTPTRLPWSTASGATVVPALLVDGVPYVLLPDGVTLTSVSWTTSADSLWWAGTSGFTTKGWLALPGDDRDAPPLVLEEHARPVQRELDVAHVTVVLDDLDGEVTQLLRSRTAMPATILTATLTAAGTTVTVESTGAFPSSYPYTIHLGGEAMAVSGKTSTTFTVTRAQRGTLARRHVVAEGLPPPAVYGPATDGTDSWEAVPSLRGRRATLWLLRITAAGTATDPTLIYTGMVGDGIRATADGAGWEVPLDHATKALGQKIAAPKVTTYGWAHAGGRVRGSSTDEIPGEQVPLAVRWNDNNYVLNDQAAAPDSGGWHRDRASFLSAFRAGIADAGGAAELSVEATGDGRLHIIGLSGAPSTLLVSAAWLDPPMLYWPDRETPETAVDFASGQRMPEHCYWLSGRVYLGAADLARIPGMLGPGGVGGLVDASSGTFAFWTLGVKEGSTWKRSYISDVQSTYVVAEPLGPPGDRLLMTRAASPEVGLLVRSRYWWTALRYGLFGGLDATLGALPVVDSVHWERLTEVATSTVPVLTGVREYVFDWKRSPLDVYLAELTLAGLVPSTYHGRLAACRVHQVAPTEPSAATITADDILDGDALQTFTESVDGLATRFRLEFPSGDEIGVTDVGAEAESGPGAEIRVEIPAGTLATSVLDEAFRARVLSQATTILGPWRRPYDMIQLPLPLIFAGLELGDVVTLSEWLLPTQEGTRGVSLLACTVLGRRVDFSAGEVLLDVLPSSPLLAGYAPEAMIASISGAVLTVDTSSAFLGGSQGDYGFADERLPSGALRTDGGASSFAVGDKVRLYELDDTAPDVSGTFEILSISGTSITLDGSPGAPWTTHASGAGNGKVLLEFVRYADATATQRRNCYIADGTTLLINSAAQARRFAG